MSQIDNIQTVNVEGGSWDCCVSTHSVTSTTADLSGVSGKPQKSMDWFYWYHPPVEAVEKQNYLLCGFMILSMAHLVEWSKNKLGSLLLSSGNSLKIGLSAILCRRDSRMWDIPTFMFLPGDAVSLCAGALCSDQVLP